MMDSRLSVRLGRGLKGCLSRRLLLASGCLLCLLGVPAGAAAATRVYTLADIGEQSEQYSVDPGTNGYNARTGCAVSEHGSDVYVYWRDVWTMTATVYPKSGHIKIDTIRRKSGPTDPKHRGDSEIQGQAHDTLADENHQCTKKGYAGAYDCTAEAVVPHGSLNGDPVLPMFRREGKAFVITYPGYAGASAKYTGSSPRNWSCSEDIGTNLEPGGFVFADYVGAYSWSQHLLTDSDILNLKVHHALRSSDQNPFGGGWLDDHFPKYGSTESVLDGETLKYGTTYRHDAVYIKRVR